jgi:hypothetical protein
MMLMPLVVPSFFLLSARPLKESRGKICFGAARQKRIAPKAFVGQ